MKEGSVKPGGQECRVMLDLSPAGINDRAKRFGTEFWQLRTPLTQYRIAGPDTPYGVDNGCYSGKLPRSWGAILREAREIRPLWVCSPDVVGSARRTLELWDRFARTMNGLPRALVLQDGIGEFSIPWEELAAVFVGGTDAFKTSDEARHAAITARMLGKWVHVGRVNTHERALFWRNMADSVDGSGASRYDHMLASVLAGLSGHPPVSPQLTMPLEPLEPL